MPPVQHVRDGASGREVRLCGNHRREKHDVRERDSHTAASERVAHVPRVAENHALVGMRHTLSDGKEE